MFNHEPVEITPEIIRARRLESFDLRGAAWAVLAIGVAVFGFILASALLQIDETARATGEVIAKSRVQIIQSVDGGVIKEILVREGDIVEAGQVLARMDDDRILTNVNEVSARLFAARIKAARLRAEVVDADTVSFDPEAARTYPDLVAIETALFAQRRNGLKEDLRTLQSGLDLARQEQQMVQVLVSSQDSNQMELLRVNRQVNDADAAIVQRRNRFLEEAQTALSAAQDDISQSEQVLRRHQQELQSTAFAAALRGIVKNIRVTTIGGVLHSGEELMQIVPLDDTRIIEVKVLPKDIARVAAGLPAAIRLDPFDYTMWGFLPGRVTYVSADTIKEEGAAQGQAQTFYRVYVQPDGDETSTGRKITIVPGMTGQIDIRTGSRSLLEYLLKPLRKTLAEAFRER